MKYIVFKAAISQQEKGVASEKTYQRKVELVIREVELRLETLQSRIANVSFSTSVSISDRSKEV
jgi:hypothetical protein